jgi:hypothetical protein
MFSEGERYPRNAMKYMNQEEGKKFSTGTRSFKTRQEQL